MSGVLTKYGVMGLSPKDLEEAAKDRILIQESIPDRKIVFSVVIPVCDIESEENWAKPIIRALALLAKKVWDEYKRRGGR